MAEYILTINAEGGSVVVVQRTFSAYGATGVLSDGDTLYQNDKLKITFSVESGYALRTHLVNGHTFSSGNTHIVSGNVAVVCDAVGVYSAVEATDAVIGGTSVITVSKNGKGHYHSLKYAFGSQTGYISNGGDSVTDPEVYRDENVLFIIPNDFSEEIDGYQSKTCTITCTTFSDASGSVQIGTSTCNMTIRLSDSGVPDITGVVLDTNEVTKSLTGDSKTLVRYMSTAECTIQATAKDSATIVSTSVNAIQTSDNTCVFENVSNPTFIFSATDSRGRENTKMITSPMIEYIRLTLHPTVKRVQGSSNVELSFSGKFFNGSFGACDNTLTVQYRYRLTGESDFSDWVTVDPSDYSKSTVSYSTDEPIVLADEFDYSKGYMFEVRAFDGSGENVLSVVTKEVVLTGGIPLFDWGEGDINFNIDILIRGVNILSIIYPVGAVFTSSVDALPESIESIGSWETIQSSSDGLYMWKRTL